MGDSWSSLPGTSLEPKSLGLEDLGWPLSHPLCTGAMLSDATSGSSGSVKDGSWQVGVVAA